MPDAAEQNTSIHQPPPPIRWRSWPVRDEPLHSAVIAGGLLIAVVTVYGVAGRAYLAVLALAALAIALRRFFVPVEYELSEDGVDRWLFGRQRRIRWQAVGRYEVCRQGVLLFPYKDLSVLAVFRGLYVPFLSHREEILAHVRHYLDQPEEAQL